MTPIFKFIFFFNFKGPRKPNSTPPPTALTRRYRGATRHSPPARPAAAFKGRLTLLDLAGVVPPLLVVFPGGRSAQPFLLRVSEEQLTTPRGTVGPDRARAG